MSSVARGLTLKVKLTGLKRWSIRVWLGAWIIRMAARVIGCNVEISSEKTV